MNKTKQAIEADELSARLIKLDDFGESCCLFRVLGSMSAEDVKTWRKFADALDRAIEDNKKFHTKQVIPL